MGKFRVIDESIKANTTDDVSNNGTPVSQAKVFHERNACDRGQVL